MKHETITLTTDKLILRKYDLTDAKDMYENWASDDDVTRHLSWPTHPDVSVTEKIIKEWVEGYETKDYYRWTICLKDNIAIGDLDVIKRLDDVPVIGFCMSKKYWGTDIMPEAIKTMMDFLFNSESFEKLCSYHDVNNKESRDVLSKCGLRFIENRPGGLVNRKGTFDMDYYEITKEEYNQLAK